MFFLTKKYTPPYVHKSNQPKVLFNLNPFGVAVSSVAPNLNPPLGEPGLVCPMSNPEALDEDSFGESELDPNLKPKLVGAASVLLLKLKPPLVAGVDSDFSGVSELDPNLKPPPVAGVAPLLVFNLKPSLVAGVVSVSFATSELDPNLKPPLVAGASSVLALNLKPPLVAGAASVLALNLKPPLVAGAASVLALNLKPPLVAGAASVLVLNLKPPPEARGVSVLVLNLKPPLAPKEKFCCCGSAEVVAAAAGTDPGFGFSQATHLSISALLDSIQISQDQVPPDLGFINLANRSSGLLSGCSALDFSTTDGSASAATTGTAPGFGFSQATHFRISALLDSIQISQDQVPPDLGFINLANRSSGLLSALDFSVDFSFSESGLVDLASTSGLLD